MLPPIVLPFILVLLALLPLAVAMAEEVADLPLVRVSLQLQWKHQFEFAGYYAAIEQGFYRDHGLEVELREYHPRLDVLDAVRSGEVTFGLTHGQVIAWRLQGEPVVLLANYFRKPPFVLLTRAGLHSLAALRGGRLMAAPDDLLSPLLRAALRNAGLVPGENLTIVPHSFDASPLIRGEIDAMTAFVTNDPFDLESKGVGFQILELGGYLPGLGDGYLFTSEAQARDQPEVTRAFVEASNAGWRYALEHTDALIDLIRAHYAPQRSHTALRYEATRTHELMQTPLLPIGAVAPVRIELAAAAMLETGMPGEAARLAGFVDPLSLAASTISAPKPMKSPVEPLVTTPLTDTQRDWLQKQSVIRYTLWNDRAPVEYVDAAGQPSGMSTDYLAIVARDLGLPLEFIPSASWTETLERVRAGEIDLLPSAAPSAARSDALAFTDTYLELPVAIFAPLEAPFYGSLEALRDQRVAVIKGTVTEDWLRRDHPELQLVALPTAEAGMHALERGEAVALVDTLLTFSHVIGRDGPPRLRMAGNTPYRISLAMAVRRELAPLAKMLNQALAAIPPAEREAIEQRWMQTPRVAQIDYRLLWQVLSGAVFIIAIILYWNWRLSRTQAALARSETYYRTLIATMAEGLLVHGRDGLIRTCNAAAARVLGQREEALIGQVPGWQLRREDGTPLPMEQQPALVTLRTRVAQRNVLLALTDANGGPRWIALNTAPLVLEPDAAPDAVLVTFTDVTERVRAEQSLRESQARYDEIVRLIPVGIYTLSQYRGEPETLAYLSPRGLQMLGLSNDGNGPPPSIEGLFALVEPEDRERLVLANQVNIKENFFWEGRIHVHGGIRWYRLESVAAPQSDTFCIWQGVITDITAQKEAEAALIQARQEAEAANRAKSDFLANMSHEIRTPMNSVLGMMHLCLETELTAPQRQYLDQAQRAARALLGLLNDILDFSKVEAGEITLEAIPFALSGVLNDLHSVVSRQAKDKGLILHIERDPAIPDALQGDPLRLGQVLINLVNNAIKFTELGNITISVSLVRLEREQVWLAFRVRDTGIGMSEDQISRLFQPFHQADTSITRRYGGTGLGLSICKRLMELMQGDITVTSQPGRGSTFALRLALRLAPANWQPPTNVPPISQNQLVGRRILVVEDDSLNRIIARTLLERAGAHVEEAEQGLMALELIDKQGTKAWDLILMDIHMPELDGLEATQRIRARPDGAAIPIIGLSASTFPEDIAATQAVGMNAHLGKPVNPHTLFTELARWLPVTETDPIAVASAEPSATPAAPFTPPDAATRAAIQPIINQLLTLTLALDAEAEDYFLAHRADIAKVLPPADCAALAHHIEGYRFPDASALLKTVETGPPA